MNHGSRSTGQLFGHVSALKASSNVEAVLSHYASYLFDGEIGIATQLRNIAAIVFVGENESDSMSRLLESFVQPAYPPSKLRLWCQILAFNRRCIFENLDDRCEVAGMIACDDLGLFVEVSAMLFKQ
jgi:hypothetical protein